MRRLLLSAALAAAMALAPSAAFAAPGNGNGDAALSQGLAEATGVVRSFVCPVIPAHGPHV